MLSGCSLVDVGLGQRAAFEGPSTVVNLFGTLKVVFRKIAVP